MFVSWTPVIPGMADCNYEINQLLARRISSASFPDVALRALCPSPSNIAVGAQEDNGVIIYGKHHQRLRALCGFGATALWSCSTALALPFAIGSQSVMVVPCPKLTLDCHVSARLFDKAIDCGKAKPVFFAAPFVKNGSNAVGHDFGRDPLHQYPRLQHNIISW